MPGQSFTRQADELLALTTEIELDGDLVDAVRELREVSVEADRISVRFEQAAEKVKQLLVGRMTRK